jgi:lipase
VTAILWQSLGAGDGPPALGIHCALGRGRDLGVMRLPLSLRALDLPGHGASALWDGVGDYHDACTHAARGGLDCRQVVIGHSLGATIALRLALEQPERVAALVLMEPVLFAAARGTAEYAAHAPHDARFAACMAAGDHDSAAAGFLDLWGVGVPLAALPASDRSRIAAQMSLIAATAPALFDDAAHMLRTDGLEGLALPVLLVRGSASPAITGAIHRALAARLPRATMVEVAGAGHMAPLTHARDVAAQITTFLGQV